MSLRLRILPYRKGSKSAVSLCQSLENDVKLLRLEGSTYKPRSGDVIINWGNSTTDLPSDVDGVTWFNKPDAVNYVSNKLNFFRLLSDYSIAEDDRPRIPLWTQSKEEVNGWLDDDHTVFARTKLTGHSGEGIEIITKENRYSANNYPDNTLFTRYQKKRDEYRVHFFNGEIFDIQRKAKVNDRDDANFMIRSHANGFIYSRNNVGDVPKDVHIQVNKTVKHLGLEFGAVDVIYNKLHDKAFVLEVNTAPGLEGTTLDNYISKFDAAVNEIKGNTE